MKKIAVEELAHGRSGDKGNDANIALIAYTEAGYQHLLKVLTAEKIKAVFSPLGVKAVRRYELPNLLAVNYVLEVLGTSAAPTND